MCAPSKTTAPRAVKALPTEHALADSKALSVQRRAVLVSQVRPIEVEVRPDARTGQADFAAGGETLAAEDVALDGEPSAFSAGPFSFPRSAPLKLSCPPMRAPCRLTSPRAVKPL